MQKAYVATLSGESLVITITLQSLVNGCTPQPDNWTNLFWVDLGGDNVPVFTFADRIVIHAKLLGN
jgi:hypothetical protein